MPDRRLRFRDLRRIVKQFGVWEDESKGKGSHTTFLRTIDGHRFSYPIPTHSTEVAECYVKGLRRKLKLTEADGVSDSQFYEYC